MCDELNPNPIGEPEPVQPRPGRKILKRLAVAAGVTVGGVLACAVLVTPTRTCGATRSAKLQWQQRQAEIEQTLATAASIPPDATPVAAEAPSSTPVVP